MIRALSRVHVRPADPRIYEMLKVTDGYLAGTVVAAHEPAPFTHDSRVRWCVRLDNNHYGLFHEHELEEITHDLETPPASVQSQ